MKMELVTESDLFSVAWGWLKALAVKLKENAVSLAKRFSKLGQDDPRRVIHSLKVGFALTLVSLLYFARPLYDGFGVSGMSAVLTVAVVFEFTVGGTLSKSLNRGFATLLAGALGVGAQHLANLSGEKGKPFVLALLVFLLAVASTFLRFFPGIKKSYDYGVLIFILTFSLVSVTGYRVDQLLVYADHRVSTILIGGATCMIVSILICPVWAGEDLHNLVASNIDKLASYLEGFGAQYFQCCSGEVSKDDKSFLQTYKSILNSKSTEESLANFARWEPAHGRFGLRHPWKQYLKIGGLARKCGYHIEALNGYVASDIQACETFMVKIKESCETMSLECGKALKAMVSSMKTMTTSSSVSLHIDNSKNAVKELKIALKTALLDCEELVIIMPIATIVSILIEVVKCVEEISKSVEELYSLAEFKVVMEQSDHKGSLRSVAYQTQSNAHVVITVPDQSIQTKSKAGYRDDS